MNSAISKIDNKSNIMDMSTVSGPPMFEEQPSTPFQPGPENVQNMPELILENRKVPSELKSRPKLPRTPAEGQQREDPYNYSINLRDNQGQDILPAEDLIPKIKGIVVKDET